jgi:hypothetical protein
LPLSSFEQDDWNESDPGSRAERHLADGVESRVNRIPLPPAPP